MEEKTNLEMLEGKMEVPGDFICPILGTIPLDLVQMNEVLFERSAVEKYIEGALTDEINDVDQPREVKCMMTRLVLYTKDGNNSAVIEKADITEIIGGLTSPVGIG